MIELDTINGKTHTKMEHGLVYDSDVAMKARESSPAEQSDRGM